MQPKITLTLCDNTGERFFGPGPCRLLEEIRRQGSLRAAAQAMGMAYTKALGLLSRAEKELGFPLTRRTIGGRGGGGSALTDEAEELLVRYHACRTACEDAAGELFRQTFARLVGAAVQQEIGCIVMASGLARRFGSNKLLAPLGGEPLLAHTLAALPMELTPCVVTRNAEVQAFCENRGTKCLRHAGPLQSDTIRCGLAAPEAENWAGCLFMAGDQPLVKPESIRALLAAFAETPDRACRLSWQGKGGNPVIFPRRLFARLCALRGDVGGGTLLGEEPGKEPARLVEAAEPWELWDADTPEQLAELKNVLVSNIQGGRLE